MPNPDPDRPGGLQADQIADDTLTPYELEKVAFPDALNYILTWSDTEQKFEFVTASSLSQAVTKSEFFLPNTNASGTKGNYSIASVNANGNISLTFHIPDDFVTLMSIVLHYIPTGTIAGGKTIDLSSDYALPGQIFSFNNETDVGVALTGTADVLETQDLASVFSSLQASHQCGINWKNNSIGTTISIVGIELIYE